MVHMNARGQGFDVFKLLIAAVVAGAILLILLQTLQVLPAIGSTTANNAATNAVKSKVNELGLPGIIENVSFKNGDSLNARTVAEGSKALSGGEICLLVADNAPNIDSFSAGNTQVIRYTGNFEQKVRLLVVCDRSGDIGQTMDDYEYGESSDYALDVTNCNESDASSDFASDGGSKRVCLVAIIP